MDGREDKQASREGGERAISEGKARTSMESETRCWRKIYPPHETVGPRSPVAESWRAAVVLGLRTAISSIFLGFKCRLKIAFTEKSTEKKVEMRTSSNHTHTRARAGLDKRSSSFHFVGDNPSPLLLGVDVPPRSDLDPPIPRCPVTRQDAGEVVVIHQVPVAGATVLILLALVLLLVLREDQLCAPPVLAAALDIGLLAVGRAVRWLGDAEDVATLVDLEVLLEVEGEVARGVRGARHAREGRLAAGRAELLRRVLANLPAAVAAEDPCLLHSDAGEPRVNEAERSAWFHGLLPLEEIKLTSGLPSAPRSS